MTSGSSMRGISIFTASGDLRGGRKFDASAAGSAACGAIGPRRSAIAAGPTPSGGSSFGAEPRPTPRGVSGRRSTDAAGETISSGAAGRAGRISGSGIGMAASRGALSDCRASRDCGDGSSIAGGNSARFTSTASGASSARGSGTGWAGAISGSTFARSIFAASAGLGRDSGTGCSNDSLGGASTGWSIQSQW